MIPRRTTSVLILLAVLLLVCTVAVLWHVLDWPPPRLILKYGLPGGGASGRFRCTSFGLAFCEVRPGYFRSRSGDWVEVDRAYWISERSLSAVEDSELVPSSGCRYGIVPLSDAEIDDLLEELSDREGGRFVVPEIEVAQYASYLGVSEGAQVLYEVYREPDGSGYYGEQTPSTINAPDIVLMRRFGGKGVSLRLLWCWE